MDPRSFIQDLFGRGGMPTLTLRHPMKAVRVRMNKPDMLSDGWLHRLCLERMAAHGDETLQLVRPTGEAIATIQSTAAVVAISDVGTGTPAAGQGALAI